MKKFLGYIFLFSAFVLGGIVVSSCIINSSEAEKIKSPTVTVEGTIYTLSFQSDIGSKTMKHANIIRWYDSDSDFKNAKKTNIGQVIPSNVNKQSGTYQFKDAYTATGTYYKYQIRYFDGSVYQYSELSEPTLEGLTTSECILTGTIDVNAVVDESAPSYTLQLDSAVTMPSGFTKLQVALNNGTNTKPFFLATASDAEANSASAIILQDILSQEFLNTEISIEGLIASKETIENEDGAEPYKWYYWSNINEPQLNWTWTDSNGDPVSVDPANTSLTVPNRVNDDNNFDLNLSIAF